MKYLGFLLILLSLALLLLWYVSANNENKAKARQQEIYALVKERYLTSTGRVNSDPGKTSSESQSYLMLMAVLNNDRSTFVQVWSWTEENMQIRGDHLFAWLWENGEIKDRHAATDADQDIALALLIAAELWQQPEYLQEARLIMRDIWEKETKIVAGARYLVAGDWAQQDTSGAVTNPSYFAPYIYRIFSRVDPERDWLALVETGYRIMPACSQPRGLPKNWCKLSNQGQVVKDFSFPEGNAANLFSYDAMRVPFRLALDYRLFAEERARRFLESTSVFSSDWGKEGKIFAIYDEQGRPQVSYESYASYGAQLASFSMLQQTTADRIFREKIAKVNPDAISFFDLSWLWFGLRFYTDGYQEWQNLGIFSASYLSQEFP